MLRLQRLAGTRAVLQYGFYNCPETGKSAYPYIRVMSVLSQLQCFMDVPTNRISVRRITMNISRKGQVPILSGI